VAGPFKKQPVKEQKSEDRVLLGEILILDDRKNII
jgi:hypothetical protein